jgi:hypothetical protein
MNAEIVRMANGERLIAMTGDSATHYLTVAEARDLAHQLSRAAANADAMNRQRAKEPVTS